MLNFSISELCASDTAKRYKILNIPSVSVCDNLLNLIFYVFQPLRNKLNKAVIISSGYRCKELNVKVGGAPNSQHLYGQAADITVPGMTPWNLWMYIQNSGIEYDQCILEYNQWVHLSFNKGKNRKQAFRID